MGTELGLASILSHNSLFSFFLDTFAFAFHISPIAPLPKPFQPEWALGIVGKPLLPIRLNIFVIAKVDGID